MFVSNMRRRLIVSAVTLMTSFGVMSVSIAQNKPPLKIGFGMGLTGGMAANGKAALVSMEIWREEINKKGGLLGRQVEFVYYDDQSNPSLVPGIYTKLLDIE